VTGVMRKNAKIIILFIRLNNAVLTVNVVQYQRWKVVTTGEKVRIWKEADKAYLKTQLLSFVWRD
jgi:hypothetical protein